MPNSDRQTGLAIITVLLIVALMVTLLGFLAEQQHLLIRRISNQNVAEKGYQYALGVNAWAQRVLHDDANREIDYLDEDWAKFGKPPEVNELGEEEYSLTADTELEEEELPTIDFGDEAELEFEIIDLQSRYNLNNLANKNPEIQTEQAIVFNNLLELVGIDEINTRQELYSALKDWLDENDEGSNESIDYRVKESPYHASDQKLVSLAELRFVEGFTPEIINLLKPYVTVLPIDYAKFNINSVSPELLSALSTTPVVDTSSVQAFLSTREEEAFLGFQANSIELAKNAIIAVNPLGSPIVENMMQANSNFFQVNTEVSIGDFNFCMQTLMLRENPNADSQSTPRVQIMSRQHDTFALCETDNSDNNTVVDDENLS